MDIYWVTAFCCRAWVSRGLSDGTLNHAIDFLSILINAYIDDWRGYLATAAIEVAKRELSKREFWWNLPSIYFWPPATSVLPRQ